MAPSSSRKVDGGVERHEALKGQTDCCCSC